MMGGYDHEGGCIPPSSLLLCVLFFFDNLMIPSVPFYSWVMVGMDGMNPPGSYLL